MEEISRKSENQNEHKTNRGLMDKLVKIEELMELLGYTDHRSIDSWCKKNKVPLFHVGKRTYTLSTFIHRFISQKMEEFVKASFANAEEVLTAIQNDDKETLAILMDAPASKTVKMKFKEKANSKAAEDFINKLKKAA